MKVVNSCLFVNVENQIVCGDGSFKAIVEHQIIVSELGADVEFVDIHESTFMGLPIGGYSEFKKFKTKMSEIGIDIDKMIEDACVGLISDSFIKTCEDRFAKAKM